MIKSSILVVGRFYFMAASLSFALVLRGESFELPPKVDALPSLESAQRVLVIMTHQRGKDAYVYKQVTPPADLSAFLSPVAPVAPATPVEIVDVEALDMDAQRDNLVIFNCSVVTHLFGVSEIQWSDAEGRQKRVFAHEDLTYLQMSSAVKLGEITYSYTILNYGLFGEEAWSAYPTDMRRDINRAREVPKGGYVVVPAATGLTYPPSEEERDALEVLLAHYQINRDVLRLDHEAAVARGKIEAEARRIRALTPQTYELRFWPVLSQRYTSQP